MFSSGCSSITYLQHSSRIKHRYHLCKIAMRDRSSLCLLLSERQWRSWQSSISCWLHPLSLWGDDSQRCDKRILKLSPHYNGGSTQSTRRSYPWISPIVYHFNNQIMELINHITLTSFCIGFIFGISTTLLVKHEKVSLATAIALIISFVWLGLHIWWFVKNQDVAGIFDVMWAMAVGSLMSINAVDVIRNLYPKNGKQ